MANVRPQIYSCHSPQRQSTQASPQLASAQRLLEWAWWVHAGYFVSEPTMYSSCTQWVHRGSPPVSFCVQCDGSYLVAGYESGEILILDLTNVK